MAVRKVTTANKSTNVTSVKVTVGDSTTSNTKVKRVTLGRPVRRVVADNGSLSNLNDIDASTPEDGDVLVWHEDTQKWVAQKLLDKQLINGGQY